MLQKFQHQRVNSYDKEVLRDRVWNNKKRGRKCLQWGISYLSWGTGVVDPMKLLRRMRWSRCYDTLSEKSIFNPILI